MSHASSPAPTALVGVDAKASGQDDDRKQESDSIEKEMVIKSALLEDGELEEGELDDDDDLGIDNDKIYQPTSNNASETNIRPLFNDSAADENLGKSTASTEEALKKPKEIPSLFDLKTTKPKSMKRLVEDKGKKSFPKYIDHDRIEDDGYLNYDGQDDVVVGMWSGYLIPNDDYESSDCDAVPENEFSVEIQQMLNRSSTAAATTSCSVYDNDKSPRGPYDSPSEEEEDDKSLEFQPPSKLQKVEEASCVSYGLVTVGSKNASKKQMMMASGLMTSCDSKKTKVTGSRTRKRGEPSLSESKSAVESLIAAEKRRLVDTPMEERPQCKFYFEGKCKKGANCPFNHDVKRLTKSEPCRFYLLGQCSRGNDCVFSHELKSSGEEADCKTDTLVPKKRKALLVSPPAMQPRMMQPKDKKKIPSLFDIQINADGPNAKEILQSAARRSVMMQSTNPKPGLLGVAPPMIAAAGMIGPVRTRFPVGAQGYFENLARPQPHEKVEDGAQEMLRQGSDFTGCGMEDNVPAQQMNFLNREQNDRKVTAAVEITSQSLSTDLSCSSSMYCSTSVNSNIQFVTQNNFSSELESVISVPSNSHCKPIPPESTILSPPSANPSLFPQLGHSCPLSPEVSLPSSTDEMDTSTMTPVLPTVEDSIKPWIVGGVDINHLPPKQRELYLRMFAHQKQTEVVPTVQLLTDKTSQRNRADEEITHALGNSVNIHSSADLLKLLIPVSSQFTSQSLVPETVMLNQSLKHSSSSSGSSFNINRMLSVICGREAGLNMKQIPLSATGPPVLENAKPAEPVFEVSDSHLRGPYQLQCVTRESEAITLPSYIDPKDPKYTFDPRVQKHKDDIIVPSPQKSDQQTLNVLPVEPIVKVHASVQRRDPRLARKEVMTVKEAALKQPQQQQLAGLSVQYGVMRGTGEQNPNGAMQHSNIPVGRGMQQGSVPEGGNMQHGNLPVGGMMLGKVPMGSMQQGNMPVGGMQQGNMPMGSMQQGNMLMGGMQQGSMLVEGMQQGNMPSGCIQQDNMPVRGIQQIMSAGGMQQGSMSVGGMQQSNMPMGNMQQGNMHMGGMQMQTNMPVGVVQQSGTSVGPVLHGGIRAEVVQQSSMMMGCVQQGGMTNGSIEQSGMSAGGMQLGAIPSSRVLMSGMQLNGISCSGVHQGGISVNGMQQCMNIPVGMHQQGGLLPQPSGSLLPQRGLVPPFLIQSRISAINSFPQSVNTQPPFSICSRPGMSQNDLVRHESMPKNHDRPSDIRAGVMHAVTLQPANVFTSGPAAANLVGACTGDVFVSLIQSNPGFARPLLPTPFKVTSVITGPSVSPSLRPSYSSLQTVTTHDDINHQSDSFSSSEEHHATQLCDDVEVTIGNEDGCNQISSQYLHTETLDATLTSDVERTVRYRQDHRFRIKKAPVKDFVENSSDNKKDSDMLVKAYLVQSIESGADTRETSVRNRDKLEFRSPLADMGDSGTSLLISSYNQPPNKKYQQLAEENNLRRSVLSKATYKNSGKQKQQSMTHQMLPAAQNKLLPPEFSNLQPTPESVNSEITPSVQSIKDMFKSIDPTASPFC